MWWRVALIVVCVGACKRSEKEPTGRERNEIMRRDGAVCDRQDIGPPARGPCRSACRFGHSNSCYRLGVQWRDGLDGPKSVRDARHLFAKACKGGSGLGCAALAGMPGTEAQRDALWRDARNYARVHCEQGHRESCAAFAEMAEAGRGGPADPGQVWFFLSRACKLGLKSVCDRVPKNPG